MRRVFELIGAVVASHPEDKFFADFERTLNQTPGKLAYYRAYERAFSTLDDVSWCLLKQKAIRHFRQHRPGQLKEGFFNQLNEAFAYRYLVQRGHTDVRLVVEDQVSRPDIAYREAGQLKYCEVKTIGVSENEISRREGSEVINGSTYVALDSGFFRKLNADIDTALSQIEAQCADGLVFLVARFDDFTLAYYENYRRQIAASLYGHRAPEIYLKIDLAGSRRIYKTRGRHAD